MKTNILTQLALPSTHSFRPTSVPIPRSATVQPVNLKEGIYHGLGRPNTNTDTFTPQFKQIESLLNVLKQIKNKKLTATSSLEADSNFKTPTTGTYPWHRNKLTLNNQTSNFKPTTSLETPTTGTYPWHKDQITYP